MYKHILIPTDGSELSNMAIRHGVALAKAVNAKVTGITVTTPFHLIAMDPETLTDTADTYKKRTTGLTAKYLKQVNDAAAAAGISCAVIHVEHEHPYRAIIDDKHRRCGGGARGTTRHNQTNRGCASFRAFPIRAPLLPPARMRTEAMTPRGYCQAKKQNRR